MQRTSGDRDAGTLRQSVTGRGGVPGKASRSDAAVAGPQEDVDRREQTSDRVRETGRRRRRRLRDGRCSRRRGSDVQHGAEPQRPSQGLEEQVVVQLVQPPVREAIVRVLDAVRCCPGEVRAVRPAVRRRPIGAQPGAPRGRVSRVRPLVQVVAGRAHQVARDAP